MIIQLTFVLSLLVFVYRCVHWGFFSFLCFLFLEKSEREKAGPVCVHLNQQNPLARASRIAR